MATFPCMCLNGLYIRPNVLQQHSLHFVTVAFVSRYAPLLSWKPDSALLLQLVEPRNATFPMIPLLAGVNSVPGFPRLPVPYPPCREITQCVVTLWVFLLVEFFLIIFVVFFVFWIECIFVVFE